MTNPRQTIEERPPLPDWAEPHTCFKCGLPLYWNNSLSSSSPNGWIRSHSGECPSKDDLLMHLLADAKLLRVAVIELAELAGRHICQTDEAEYNDVTALQAVVHNVYATASDAMRGAWAYANVEALAALLPKNIEQAIAALPQAEQDEYRRCQQSVIDARRSAERIEGQLWIG